MSESIWKKELSFRRKPKQETLRVVEAAPPVVQAVAPVLEAAPPVVDATPLPIDPMTEAVQQLAVATDQTSTQAAAVAVDALLQFLVVAAPEQAEQPAVEPVSAQPAPVEPAPVEPQVVQPEVALPEPALIPSADPVRAEPAPLEPPAPEVVPPLVELPVEQAPAPVAAVPEPQPIAHVDPEPAIEEHQGGHVVELWPSDTVVDDAAWMRSDIDDALMPRSLPLEQQLEFMHEQTDPVLPTPAPDPVRELQPPVVNESPLPEPVVVAPPVPQPAAAPIVPEPVAVAPPLPAPPATPVVPEPVEPVQQAAVPAPVVPEPIVAAPTPEPAPPAPARPVVSQPVVVQRLPPVAQAPTAVPVIPPQPIAAPVTVEPEPVQAQPAPAAAPALPFWKREISLGGKKQKKQKAEKTQKTQKPGAAPASTESAPAQPSVPFWKKVGVGKKKSGPNSPQAKSAKPKTPLLKRQVKLGIPKFDLSSLANRKVGMSEYTTDLDKLVGLRIGSSQLAAALVHNNGSAELMKIARSPLKPGLVTAGEVHDVNGLASALKSFFSQHKLPRRGVRIGVATNRIGVRVMEVPALDDPKAAANAVRFRAQEVLPFPLTEAVVDHVDLGEGPNDTRRVLIAFAHRGLIDQYVDACKRAKLKLAGIDFDAFALLRAVTAKRDSDEEWTAALVALAIGHDRTIFAVSDGHVCEFTRVLDWGGSAIDTALAEALDVPPEVAEKLKLELSLSGEPEHPNLAPEGVELARKAIRESLQLLARELVASLQFYQSRPGSLAIGELLITGGGAGLAGLDAELTRMLGVPVQIADPFAGVDVGAGVSVPDDGGSLAIAIGLAIEDQH
jgi:type IV pilus assembly protein PilM